MSHLQLHNVKKNLAFTLENNTLFYILPCKQEETFLSTVTKAAELLLLKTAG